MTPALAQLVADTISILEAVAQGDVHRAKWLAGQVRQVAWMEAMPALASAAGALEFSLDHGAASEGEMTAAIQSIASEMRAAVRDLDG